MPPLTPVMWETLAQSYAVRILAGDIEIDAVPSVPAKLKPRVLEILEGE